MSSESAEKSIYSMAEIRLLIVEKSGSVMEYCAAHGLNYSAVIQTLRGNRYYWGFIAQVAFDFRVDPAPFREQAKPVRKTKSST